MHDFHLSKDDCDNSIVGFETFNKRESDQLIIWVENLLDLFNTLISII